MSIVLNTVPADYSSIHGDLLFTAYEATKTADPATYPNYKYVCDVYVNDVSVARLKSVPNPVNNRGIFNIGKVVRAYVNLQFAPAGTLRAQELGEGEFFVTVQCKFGEEYSDTLYSNRTVDDYRFYFNHYNGRLVGTSSALTSLVGNVVSNRPVNNRVQLSGGRSFISFMPDSSSVPVEIKTYNSANSLVDTQNTTFTAAQDEIQIIGFPATIAYSMTGDSVVEIDMHVAKTGTDFTPLFDGDYFDVFTDNSGTFPAKTADILTIKMTSDSVTYPWPAGTPWASLKVEADGVVIFYKEVYVQGTVADIMTQAEFAVEPSVSYVITIHSENSAHPGLPDVDDTSVAYGSTTNIAKPYSLQIFDVSPAKINATFASLITSTTKYYTVQIEDDLYRFDLYCESKYDRYTLHFLNQYGGFESFDFSKVSRKTNEIEKRSFEQLPYTVNSSGVVEYYNSTNVYNQNKPVYASLFTERLRVTSDLLTDEEYVWLGELVKSPLVYIESGDYLVPVMITANNYEERKRINDKLTSLVLELDYGGKLNAQYR